MVTERSRTGVAERLLWWSYDAFRSPRAYERAVGQLGDLRILQGHKHALLVTFRRDGTAVPSPMWFGLRDGRVYMKTGAETWKVKRIANDPRVVVAPATVRGRPLGPGVSARARILPPEEYPGAISARIANYGAGRWLYDRTVARFYGEVAYLEISAVDDPSARR